MIYIKDFDYNLIIEEMKKDGVVYKNVKQDDGSKKKVCYSETVFTLDTETTSYFITPEHKIIMFDEDKDNDYYKECKKQGLMYIWMFGINEIIVYGRTGEELKDFFNKINNLCLISDTVIKKVIYVHNLGFDFHFLQNFLGTHWDVFAREANKPITAKDDFNEFRCSYFLTNMSLDNYAETYKLKSQKQKGKLDYNVFRTPYTELNSDELLYCEYDIKVLYEIIKLHKNKYGSIIDIPLTQTGKIRKQINALFYRDSKHHKTIKNASPDNFYDFKLLCQVYQGGFTHSNKLNTNKLLKNVVSYDIASSYPFECTTKKFPMSAFVEMTDEVITALNEEEETTINDFIDLENQAFIIDFTVNDLISTNSNNILSLHKAITNKFFEDDLQENYIIKGEVVDNGRLEKAKSVRYILTDIDFFIFLNYYDFSKLKINKLFVAEKDYLPVKLIQYILNLYKQKTLLKGIEEQKVKYEEIKQFLNGIYGMFVTKIIQDNILYKNGVMMKEILSEEEAIIKANEKLYNHNKNNNNLNFAWGVWVSAYARAHLLRNVLKLKNYVVYCDTDSIKILLTKDNEKIIKEVFEEDNKRVNQDIFNICCHYKELEPKDYFPLNKKIGYFEKDAEYKEFKTLGAKKYCYKKIGSEEVEITVSGLNKTTGPSRLKTVDDFKPGILFNYSQAGKKEAYYLHEQEEVIFEDGWHEKSRFGICIKPTTYYLDITVDYEDIIDIASSLLDD